LMLGDSFTEGWGVPFGKTFSKRVERLYASRGIRAEVINAGVGNYNTVMEVNYFLSEGYKYQPDIVVLNYIPNDAEPMPRHTAPRDITSLLYVRSPVRASRHSDSGGVAAAGLGGLLSRTLR